MKVYCVFSMNCQDVYAHVNIARFMRSFRKEYPKHLGKYLN